MAQYILAHTLKIAVYIIVGISQNRKSLLHQPFIALGISPQELFLIVLRTVYFHNQLRRCTIEIQNIIAKHLLSIKHDRERLQKIIPEAPFFPCHISSQSLGV